MASFPTDTFTGRSGDLDVYIPLVWGERVNDFFKAKLEMAPFFTNRSDELSGGGDTLYTPGLTEMSATAKSAGAAVTLNEQGALALQQIYIFLQKMVY